MLKRITLENFFSFGEPTTIELNNDINVLVGINGSGKSNFLKALELLHEGIAGDGLHNLLIKKWGGLDNVKSLLPRAGWIQLIYEFEFSYQKFKYHVKINPQNNIEYIFEEYLDYSYYKTNNGEWQRIINVSGGNYFPHFAGEYWANETTEIILGERSTTLSSKDLILGQVVIDYRTVDWVYSFIKEMSLYKAMDTSSASQLRKPSILGQGKFLINTGENLNSVIQNLQNNHALEYEKIEEKLKDINPNYKGITFNYFGSQIYLSLRERGLTKVIPIQHISDGTLNYLILLAIFYNPECGQLVCFDEPENGLHPDMINTIASAIKEASENTQLFIATHSPLLLNAFELDDLLVFEKDRNNQTKVIKREEDEFDGLLLGQLWLNGQIGGKRW